MSYPLHTYAIIGYIESHISEGKLNYAELERQIGFSYAHIRDFFKKHTGISLGQYIRQRQIYASAFELCIRTNPSWNLPYPMVSPTTKAIPAPSQNR